MHDLPAVTAVVDAYLARGEQGPGRGPRLPWCRWAGLLGPGEQLLGHHGASETAIYVVSGHPEFVFLDDTAGPSEEVRMRTSPDDYIFVPP